MTTFMPTKTQPLKIGTRASPLALAQAYEVRAKLMAAHDLSQDCFEIVSCSTRGDRVQDRSLRDLGGKGLFSKEIEDFLSEGAVDVAVHSTKDMAVEQPDGLVLDVFLARENPLDAFVSPTYASFDALPEGAVIGSSSLRRKSQILARRPDLQVIEFRGSVQTRLHKLKDGVADATFLARAGLNRLEMRFDDDIHVAPQEDFLPAVAQGVISIERRAADDDLRAFLAPLHDEDTGVQMAAERSFLRKLDGSCQTPIAGHAELIGDEVLLRGEILRVDGSQVISGEKRGARAEAAEIGEALADELLAQAAADFFDGV